VGEMILMSAEIRGTIIDIALSNFAVFEKLPDYWRVSNQNF